ncbi:putative late blight resistance protein homolog R1C-3 [Ipomoea triloba]|uniref:putative late blight resistance protein homolog R1C-3 n=1 Tax=Ipomoea triloba TaxID=35885 RepID=UPI00125E0A8E|nr:putative late blight resistance protein homolog R1C-3 [Ipomoea triloba]XP_031102570.1 putative late blight resistance protein homolog R1C-3 [Ipomoea triloba]XP_031102571.1 putative late blight resistance protein homolog R1C-3 [Ipomoea triloba]XP_031102572.1 putative late blight resistance protein homolog R1C-3 [Ipomoea triloba]XP_031102574.1 putative late blight resistance protein homolog R1C-3 [Ipomoea triloba]XP_031102575.1 putative late blight resistance protein homolog R1C-3 [Ipomoea tr
MAFDAVTTLIQVVEAAEQDIMEPKLLSILCPGGLMMVPLLETIELLSYNLHFLQAFLVECKAKMNDRDNRARRLYTDVQDEVARIYYKYEINSSRILLYSGEYGGMNAALKPCEDIHYLLKIIVRDIEEVKDRILEEKKRAALKAEVQNITIWDTYQSALVIENEVIVGFDSDIEKIVNRLCYSYMMRSVFTIMSNSNIDKFQRYVKNLVLKLQVIPLVGEGGIGKTTLAKRVYGHPITIASFHIRAWVVVSKVHNLKEMLIGLLRCISPITSEIYNIDEAQIAEKLNTSLMGQKYLIFLDDIWTTAAWDAIQGYFPENFNGSRILVTTRFKEVAEYLSTNPYQVKYQTFSDRWELFSRKVFGQSQYVPREYEPIGERIVLGCGGLPLVVVLISGLLATAKGSIEIWRDVARTLDGVGRYDNNKRISKIVSLSYKYLPNHLKACFKYFGVFPEDSDIPVKKLINLWVAEGFIKPHNNMSLEEVGESYLHDLINRNLVQINELSIDGKVKLCNIHDRVHEVCVREAINGNTLCIINDNHAPKASHWLSCQTSHWPITRASYGNCSPDEIHSVLCFGRDVYHSKCRLVYPCLKLLRVLDLSLVKWSQGMPREITDLVHLRYLALSTIGSLYKLRFFNLKNLRTLIVTSWIEKYPLQLPCDILDLPQLRYLHVDKKCSQYLPCLVKKDLQTLYWLKVASADKEPDFRMVPNLKELGIYIEGQLAPSYLGSLVYLHILEKLKFEVGRVERFYLPIGFPPNLKKLTFCYTYLPWKEMDTIGKLPHLQVLKLKDFAFCGSTWEPLKHGFRELKALLISRSNLKHWNASSNDFPVLERLVLRYCWELKQVPLKFAKIGTLKLIVLECCYSSLVTSANKLLFEGMDDCPLRVCKVGTKVELPNNQSSKEECVKSSKVELPNNESFEEEKVESSKEECVESSKVELRNNESFEEESVESSKEECVKSFMVELPNYECFERESDESSEEESDYSSEEECVGRSKVESSEEDSMKSSKEESVKSCKQPSMESSKEERSKSSKEESVGRSKELKCCLVGDFCTLLWVLILITMCVGLLLLILGLI